LSQDLQQNRYDRILRRVGGLIGPGSKVSEVLGELFPVLDVERIPGELLLLGGTAICHGSVNRTGAAGEVGKVQLFNPVGSGKLITVSRVLVGSNVTGVVRAAATQIALTTGVGTELFRDQRRPTPLRPTGQIRSDSTVALTDANVQFRLLANTTFEIQDHNSVAVLPPGSGYEVSMNTVASNTTATFFWRERDVEQSELNL